MSDWQSIHQRVVELRRRRGAVESDEAAALLAAMRAEVHLKLGFGTFEEYTERMLGHGHRETRERLRIAKALDELPKMSAQVASGELAWSAARELTRVVTPQTEETWLKAIAGKSVREIEGHVVKRLKGDLPGDPPDERLRRQTLRVRVTGETMATFREAVELLRKKMGCAVDDETALLTMARMTLEGASEQSQRDPAVPNYQISMTVCGRCGTSRQGETEVGDALAEMAMCDADHGESSGTPSGRPRVGVSAEARRQVFHRFGKRCAAPGCRLRGLLDVHTLEPHAQRAAQDASQLIVLCGAHHRAQHLGTLVIMREGDDLVFRHADGRPYGAPSRWAYMSALALHALRTMEFLEPDARRAISEVATHVGQLDSVEDIVTAALVCLTGGLQLGVSGDEAV